MIPIINLKNILSNIIPIILFFVVLGLLSFHYKRVENQIKSLFSNKKLINSYDIEVINNIMEAQVKMQNDFIKESDKFFEKNYNKIVSNFKNQLIS